MNKVFILFSLIIGLFIVSNANAQTKVVFAKGKMSKIMVVTLPKKGEKTYSIAVKKGQVINVELSGDIQVSKTNDFPVVSVNLENGEDADNWEDTEGFLSILAGRNGIYIFSLGNSDKKRARIFKVKVSVSNNKDDYEGGVKVQ
jgi:hypothetical protein